MLQFRIDDVGASSKQYEQHGRNLFCFSNFWFIKRMWPFKRWGPYNEISSEEWDVFFGIFEKYSIKPIIAITASWVDERNNLISFPKKFPNEAKFFKDSLWKNNITIANHGLTHCVVGRHLPSFWKSNRAWHREFWDWLPEDVHRDHVSRSQEILENFFEKPIEIFVPPGNVWSVKTYRALQKTNIKKVICNRYMSDSIELMNGIEFIDDRNGFFNFHDRELKLYGTQWLIDKIKEYV